MTAANVATLLAYWRGAITLAEARARISAQCRAGAA
jgi:hypothetical protein